MTHTQLNSESNTNTKKKMHHGAENKETKKKRKSNKAPHGINTAHVPTNLMNALLPYLLLMF